MRQKKILKILDPIKTIKSHILTFSQAHKLTVLQSFNLTASQPLNLIVLQSHHRLAILQSHNTNQTYNPIILQSYTPTEHSKMSEHVLDWKRVRLEECKIERV